MTRSQPVDNEASSRFFEDITQLYPRSSRQYRCTDISDIHYCRLGVLRCLSSSITGQEFLQFQADQGRADIAPSHFFSNGVMLRRIIYINPEDGVSYTSLTNDNTLPACQIVLL
jgi:hypothetical protein